MALSREVRVHLNLVTISRNLQFSDVRPIVINILEQTETIGKLRQLIYIQVINVHSDQDRTLFIFLYTIRPAHLARREDLPHARGQGPWPGGATPPPRSGGCADTGGPRGAIPRSRSEGEAVRRYPLTKVRSRGCTMLEQSGRDTSHPR